MAELSILIPSRNEMFLAKTIESILENIEADTEIIAVLDGAWADPVINDHPKVTLVYLPESIGQRAATNLACRLSSAKYVMKCDAHCTFDKGFDRKMIAEMKDDWTMVPMMYNLHAFDWVCKNGHRRYQSPSGPCKECGEPTERDIIWQPRKSRCTWAWYFDKDLHFQYLGGAGSAPKANDVVETMSLLGACWMLTREKYWELNICDEEHGSWGQQGTEVACKTWLSGGKLMVNRKTWFSHMFRTQGGDFSFPYPMSGKDVDAARKHSRDLWLNGKWDKAKHDLAWLVRKFNPPTWSSTKGIVYYTDNRLKWEIANKCRKELKKMKLPVVSVSLKPAGMGKNIVMDGEPSRETMFRQILTGLEASTAEYVFLCEHDVLYNPTHFDFTPTRKDKFYYNTNVWKVDWISGKAVKVDDCKQVSGLCAHRDLLIKYYKEKVANPFDGHYEPKPQEAWQSKEPIYDIRHEGNLTKSRWSPEEFRDPKYAKGWTEATINLREV